MHTHVNGAHQGSASGSGEEGRLAEGVLPLHRAVDAGSLGQAFLREAALVTRAWAHIADS